MTRRGRALARRLAVLAAVTALALAVSGDRTSAANVPATVYGQDPLEVLSLSVKPNVFVILDTSGSMQETPFTAQQYGGDLTTSKLYQAKQVLKSVFSANQTKAQFLFGTYRYSSEADTDANMDEVLSTSTPDRFLYSTQSWGAGTYPNPACAVDITTCPNPNPPTVTLPVEGPSPSMATTELYVNSLYAYQWMQNSPKVRNNTLVFSESGGVTCTATVAPGFYASGAAVATALQDAMNACGGRANTYTVTYSTSTFSFKGSTSAFTLQFADPATTMQGLLPVAISGLTRSGTTVTATTVAQHGLSTGALVRINRANQREYIGTFPVTVTGGYTFTYQLPAGVSPASPATGAITAVGVNVPVAAGGTWTTADARINLLRRQTWNKVAPSTTTPPYTETFDPDGGSTTLDPALDNPSPKRPVTTYLLWAQKFWNGETVYVDSSGNSCGITDGTPTNPPTLTLQRTTSCAGGAANADPNNKATFTWGGGETNSAGGCQGFKSRVPLVACDQLSPPQYDSIGPFLDNQLPLDASGAIKGYTEAPDGTGARVTPPAAGGVMASSNTPLAQSINDIRGIFSTLWTTGQTGPPTLDAISTHVNPKEKTIVIMVTDGLQNCYPFYQSTAPIGSAPYNPTTMTQSDAGALGTAAATQKLYDPAANGTGAGTVNSDGTINGDAAASVTTYVVGFGLQPGDKARLDVMAWGGSGLRQTFGNYSGQNTWTRFPTSAERAACTTCTDAFIAPDPDTLKKVLQAVIDVGAQSGEFSAQQSITESVYEYMDRGPGGFDARTPSQRFGGIAPVKVVSSFNMPGFLGQLRGYMNDGAGNAITVWSAGDKLAKLVAWGDPNTVMPADPAVAPTCSGGVCSCPVGRDPALTSAPRCTFSELTTTIKRRIYTTSRNGVFTFDAGKLIDAASTPPPERVSLWPPDARALPPTETNFGSLDAAYGLPPDNPPQCTSAGQTGCCYLVSPYATCTDQFFAQLQQDYGACMGTNLPSNCSSTKGATKLATARAEARQLLLAFMAGAKPVDDGSGTGWKRGASGSTAGQLLFTSRPWVLADSELATPAVVTPPSPYDPKVYAAEYKLFRSGAGGTTRANSDQMILKGFGLAFPEGEPDALSSSGEPDNRLQLKPVMTVVYAPANDMLHAFRAGPCYSPSTSPGDCQGGAGGRAESGGEELWGFVPFDQLNALGLRFVHQPQTRTNHVYMLARGIRFADVFVPGALTNVSIGGETIPSMNGVWRKVLFFGRGVGGKYVSALDVTAPGPYTMPAAQTVGPVPLWNRGNPDTSDGLSSGTPNTNQDDYNAYLRMGETWSMPTVALVNTGHNNPLYVTPRRSDGVEFVLFMGSGYGNPKARPLQGTTHYTLDALSGDVVAAPDVEAKVGAYGLARNLPYQNAIVANSVSFNRSVFRGVASNDISVVMNAWAYTSARVYFGDLYGRLWKIRTDNPNEVIPAADLGADQPVGTAVALLGENAIPETSDPDTTIPNIFVTSGADTRAAGPFRNYSLLDDSPDTQADFTTPAVPGTDQAAGVSVFPPVKAQFVRPFDPGDPEATCTYETQAVFRGTIQPTSAVECDGTFSAGKCQGTWLQRVFFGGTRLSTPATKFAPPTPLACDGAGNYPCRSQFDSILYALGAETGAAAYDSSPGTEMPYKIFRDSRIAAISFQADTTPDKGGSKLVADEGLIKGAPKPPPPPGVPPNTTGKGTSVFLRREAGQPAPVVQYGSTVCQ